jgi:hypothetical protein
VDARTFVLILIMILDATARRRFIGAAFLTAALAMLVAGETVLQERLSATGFLIFWLGCLACTFGAIIVAFRDVRALGQRVSKDQRELFETTLKKIETDARSKGNAQKGPAGKEVPNYLSRKERS